jgi:hypothetical protein
VSGRDGADAHTDMGGGTAPGRRVGWVAFFVVGISAWIAATVFVAANNDDQRDATPILRTFSLGGALFFGIMFVAAAVQLRRSTAHVNAVLYRRLALEAVSDASLREAARRTRGIGHVYLLFGGVVTALILTLIGLGESGPTRGLAAAALSLVVLWAGVARWTFARSFQGTDTLLRPLGLRVSEVPRWTPDGRLHGTLGFVGERHGHRVAIAQLPSSAVTTIAGSFDTMTLKNPYRIAKLTGDDARSWRYVTARRTDDGIVVERRGSGAGRWFLHDLALAEKLAE